MRTLLDLCKGPTDCRFRCTDRAAVDKVLHLGFRVKRRILYLFARLAGPLGLLVQIFVLARMMPAAVFADYLELYAWAVIASTISDYAMQNVLFGALRRADSTAEQRQQHYSDALTIKLYASLVTVALFGIWELVSPQGRGLWAAAWLGITLSVGDIGLIAIRGRFKPGVEACMATVEQVIALLLLVGLSQFYDLSVIAVFAVLAGCGALRTLISLAYCWVALDLAPSMSSTHQRASAVLLLFYHSTPAVLSLTLSQLYFRSPAFLLIDRMPSSDYVVFVSVFTVLLRGHLLITAFLQADFRHGAAEHSVLPAPSGVLRFALLAGCIVALPALVAPRLFVELFLGATHADSYPLAFAAALVIPLMYIVTAVRLYLQYQGRDWWVTSAAGAGLLLQVVLLSVLPLQGMWLTVPLFFSGVLFLVVAQRSTAGVRRRTTGQAGLD